MLTLSEYLARACAHLTGYQLRRPACLVFESTSRCQLACEICGGTASACSRPKGVMEWGLFEHLVEEAVRLRPERVCLHAFGEPLLHPRIVQMVEALSRQGLAAELVTNGNLLTPALARDLRLAGLRDLGISHPNVSSDNYQLCRGVPPPADLDARIAEAVAEWEGHGGLVSIRCLTIRKLLSQGAGEVGIFLNRWLTTPGVGVVAFHGYLPWPKHVCPELLDFMLAKGRRCQVGMRSLSVLWDGVITPCSYDVDTELALGRAPQDSLIKLYNGDALRELRRQWMRRSRRLPGVCRRCLVPRCPAPAAWIGRDEWNQKTVKQAGLKVLTQLTLRQNKDIHGDRV
jgi:radical SAM protein with 4Fe4S-binding SPASM domain